MDVSIIFVNYKTKDLTINAINSVIEKTENLDYEIFVVDNASNDGSIEAIQELFNGIELPINPTPKSEISTLPQGEGIQIYIIKNPTNSGFGAANNLAIRQAKGKYILCLNTDTLLVNNAIKIMFDYMEREENQNAAVCGGYLIDKDLNPIHCGGRLPKPKEIVWKLGLRQVLKKYYNDHINMSLNSDDENLNAKLEYITGADIVFRKSVLDEIGLFDENIFMYYEETDLCKRIKDAGYKAKFVEDAKIIHLEGKSTKNQLQKKKMFKTSEMYYFRKHHPKSLWLIKLIYVILYTIDWLVLKNNDSKELLFFILKGCKNV